MGAAARASLTASSCREESGQTIRRQVQNATYRQTPGSNGNAILHAFRAMPVLRCRPEGRWSGRRDSPIRLWRKPTRPSASLPGKRIWSGRRGSPVRLRRKPATLCLEGRGVEILAQPNSIGQFQPQNEPFRTSDSGRAEHLIEACPEPCRSVKPSD